MTHRQYLAWQSWLRAEWEEPSRADWYAMQTAAEVRGAFSTKGRPPVQSMRLPFEDNKPAPVVDKKTAIAKETAVSQSRWFAAIGYDKNGDCSKS